jgi:hypothetical protein
LRKKYRINGFPSFLYIPPRSKGLKVVEFDDDERNYETMKNWLFDLIDKNDKKVFGTDEESQKKTD